MNNDNNNLTVVDVICILLSPFVFALIFVFIWFILED